MQIKVEKITGVQISEREISACPVREQKFSVFEWTYDLMDEAFIMSGRVFVKSNGRTLELKRGIL